MADLFAQIKSPAFWVERNNENWMVVNPHIFGEISAETEFTLKLWLLDVTMSAKIMGYKFAPIDYQMAWDLNNKERYCYSVGLFQEVFDISVEVETLVNECAFGIIGWITGSDKKDCAWRRYKPQLPIWGAGLLNQADRVRDYVPWTCTDGSELSTWDSRQDLDGDGEPDEGVALGSHVLFFQCASSHDVCGRHRLARARSRSLYSLRSSLGATG